MELWDAYDEAGRPTGETLVRGQPVPPGRYHLVAEVLIRHRDGSWLLMRRDGSKPFCPGMWEASAGGSALQGESVEDAARRAAGAPPPRAKGALYRDAARPARDTYFGHIEILPGAGITQENAAQLLAMTGCTQIHLSRRREATDPSTRANPSLRFGSPLCPPEDVYKVTDAGAFARLRASLP